MTKKKQKPKTYVAIVLDRSGSMSGTKKQTIEGFNEQVQQMKENSKDQEIFASLVTFNGEVYEHLWNQPAADLVEANEKDYMPTGSTAMRDGMGYAIDKLCKTPDLEDENNAYLVIIISDGYENSSHRYNPSQLNEMRESLESTVRWTFSYMGCSKDAVDQVCRDYGLSASNCAVWRNDTATFARKGTKRQAQRTNKYYAARASGQCSTQNLYSDNLSMADFTADEPSVADVQVSESDLNTLQESIDNSKIGDVNVVGDLVGKIPEEEAKEEVKVDVKVDHTSTLKNLRENWNCGTVNVTYRPLETSDGGNYFNSGSQVMFGSSTEAANPEGGMFGHTINSKGPVNKRSVKTGKANLKASSFWNGKNV
jgi:uncharacterized protein YegL